jgi:hypothetical protein
MNTSKTKHTPSKEVIKGYRAIATALIDKSKITAADISRVSTVEIPADPYQSALVFTSVIFSQNELVALVSCTHDHKSGKCIPNGKTFVGPRADLLTALSERTLPLVHREVRFRINSVKGDGSGKRQFHKAVDMASFRYMLLEMDIYSKEEQIRLFAALPIPIAALIDSGNKSIHALIRLDAENLNEFNLRAGRVRDALTPLGFDSGVCYANQLGRFPGSIREGFGAYHLLLYLNPSPTCTPIIESL